VMFFPLLTYNLPFRSHIINLKDHGCHSNSSNHCRSSWQKWTLTIRKEIVEMTKPYKPYFHPRQPSTEWIFDLYFF
jgi:hypothetical protein